MIFSATGSRFGKPSASVARQRLSFSILLLGCLVLTDPANAYAVASPVEGGFALKAVETITAPTKLAQTQPAPSPTPLPASTPSARPAASPSPLPSPSPTPAGPAAASPAAPAAAQAPADEPIGNVATLTGTATVIRNKDSLPLKLQDDIFLNDVLQTSASSTLGVTFDDATTFNLTANARITVDNYIYEDDGKQNNALFDITRGTVAFVAAAVAKTGDMKISTPTATLGIRGTTGLVEVPQGGAAAGAHNIKLYPDPDGRVGQIDVHDRSGVRLGSLTQGSSGFAIRPGAGGRVTAAPLVISPQQAARDQGVVRQVHAAQVVGRQVVTQQRALRQANPNRTPRSNQPGQPQRQNNLPPRPGSPQQPGSPNRSGQQGQPKPPASPNQPGQPQPPAAASKPGQPQPPASPNRPGQQGQPPQPAVPSQPGQQGQPQPAQPPGLQKQPNAPGVRQGGGLPKPALQPKRPAAPKGKPPKDKKR
jgi:FecR protein